MIQRNDGEFSLPTKYDAKLYIILAAKLITNCNPFSTKIWVVFLREHAPSYTIKVIYLLLAVGFQVSLIKVKTFATRSAVWKSFAQYKISRLRIKHQQKHNAKSSRLHLLLFSILYPHANIVTTPSWSHATLLFSPTAMKYLWGSHQGTFYAKINYQKYFSGATYGLNLFVIQ